MGDADWSNIEQGGECIGGGDQSRRCVYRGVFNNA